MYFFLKLFFLSGQLLASLSKNIMGLVNAIHCRLRFRFFLTTNNNNNNKDCRHSVSSVLEAPRVSASSRPCSSDGKMLPGKNQAGIGCKEEQIVELHSELVLASCTMSVIFSFFPPMCLCDWLTKTCNMGKGKNCLNWGYSHGTGIMLSLR